MLGVVAAIVGRALILPSEPASKPTDTGKKRGELVRFQDKVAGFEISYPASWRRLPGDGEVRLLAGRGSASLQVRVTRLPFRIGPGSVRDARKISDAGVRASGQATLLRKPKRTELGGVPGYAYLYTFRDSASGRLGAHAHYFLFRDNEMTALVFEALPADRFTALAPLFDRVAGTFSATDRAPARRR